MENPSNQSTSLFKLSWLPLQKEEKLTFSNASHQWAQELLNELSKAGNLEAVTQDNMGENPTSLEINITLQKKHSNELQEYVLAKGEIVASFATQCVRCLANMTDHLKLNFDGCFISETLAEEPEYQDQMTIFCDQQERELYFYDKKRIDLREFAHELLHLHINPYPLHEENCKGLCPETGNNLNHPLSK